MEILINALAELESEFLITRKKKADSLPSHFAKPDPFPMLDECIVKGSGSVDIPKFEKAWYKEGVIDNRYRAARHICKTFQWNIHYYTGRTNLTKYYFYPYNFGITLNTLKEYINSKRKEDLHFDVRKEDGEVLIPPIVQILTVIPPTKIDEVTNLDYKELIKNDGALAGQSPVRFKFFKQGLMKFEHHPMLPVFDLKTTLSLVNKMKKPEEDIFGIVNYIKNEQIRKSNNKSL